MLIVGGSGGITDVLTDELMTDAILNSSEVLLSRDPNCQVPDLPISASDGNLLRTPGDKILYCGGNSPV